ncbi:MAG: SoxR reducing system RseC family protein [Pseudomonadales bacterium]|nr:SoxR reducing system RseC family protein [Pseudomonadales bacterium]
MIRQSAEIVKVESGAVWVKAPRKTACGSCAAQSSCGQNLWSRFFEDRQHPVEVRIDSDRFPILKSGAQVIIGIPESVVLHGSVRVYIMPLLFMLAAVVFGGVIFGRSDFVTILCAGLGLLFGFLVVRQQTKKNQNSIGQFPVLLELLDQSCPSDDSLHAHMAAD